MRFARKYEPVDGRLKAASTCRERGWKVDTWLNAESWNGPRKILAFDGGTSEFVKFSGPHSSARRTMVLPADTHVVPAPEKPARCQHSRKMTDPCPNCRRGVQPVERCVHGTHTPDACKHCVRSMPKEKIHA